jgi:uncharacterized membrane protein
MVQEGMMIFLDIVTVISMGLMTGTEFAMSVFINPVLWRMEDEVQGFAVRAFARLLGTVMPFWYVGNLLLLAAESIVRRSQPEAWLLDAACGVWVVVILLTLIFLVPINNRLRALPDHAFSDAVKQEHRRWDARHRLRVAALVVAMGMLLVVLLGNVPG